jgi:4-diphosphocytidyl-2-C-methyl-D-erythritol kinase
MPENKQMLTVFAPAKINLHLAVKDKRPDGFHNLESVFLALDFGDDLFFETITEENALEFSMDAENFSLDNQNNIIFKAVSIFREKTGYTTGLKILLKKHIPPGGGLGGGSSNAASALLALNKLSGGLVEKDGLLEIAASLGSDVPFFIHQTAAAWVTGRGEYIKPIKAPHFFLVLVNPGFSSNTASAYHLLDEKRISLTNSIFINLDSPPPKTLCMESIRSFYNDFLEVFNEPEKSVYNGIITYIKELSADFAGLSGSGSTCFGIFFEKSKAEKAAASLKKTWKFTKLASPLLSSLINHKQIKT